MSFLTSIFQRTDECTLISCKARLTDIIAGFARGLCLDLLQDGCSVCYFVRARRVIASGSKQSAFLHISSIRVMVASGGAGLRKEN